MTADASTDPVPPATVPPAGETDVGPAASTPEGPLRIPVPDLLHGRRLAPGDPELIRELMDTPHLGADPEAQLEMGETEGEGEGGPVESPWSPEAFQRDLFLEALLDDAFRLEWQGRRYPVARAYLLRTLSRPPVDRGVMELRQGVLRELEGSPEIEEQLFGLFRDLFTLLSLLKSPRSAQLDARSFRLEVLEQARTVVDRMVDGFAGAGSELARLHRGGLEIRRSRAWRLLSDLLDYDGRLAEMTVRVRMGADGSLRHLSVVELEENDGNHHWRPPWRRWLDRLLLMWRGYLLSRKEVARRLILEVYLQVAPALRSLLHLMGPLQVYLGARSFRRWAAGMGLDTCLAELSPEVAPRLEGLFNPLLVRQGIVPVPCDLEVGHRCGVVIVTGPNSGGKTRLLQAVGLAQTLGQAGLYAPARRARLPVAEGLFASVLGPADVAQVEGRLGSELLRIRRLFEAAHPGSLVILDELCSGTNPSEAVEIFGMVLELLSGLSPVAFISTHFLDFAQGLEERSPVPHLEFLQVEMEEAGDEQRSTYQFVPGVAESSMAAGTARRLGVSFEELSELIRERRGGEDPS